MLSLHRFYTEYSSENIWFARLRKSPAEVHCRSVYLAEQGCTLKINSPEGTTRFLGGFLQIIRNILEFARDQKPRELKEFELQHPLFNEYEEEISSLPNFDAADWEPKVVSRLCFSKVIIRS